MTMTDAAITREQYQAWLHSPPTGVASDDDGLYIDTGEWSDVVEILRRRERGESYADIARAVDRSKSTVHRVVERQDAYEWLYNTVTGGSVD